MKQYNFEKAQNEAEKMQEAIENKKAENYSEAEKVVEEDLKKSKKPKNVEEFFSPLYIDMVKAEIAKKKEADKERRVDKITGVFIDNQNKVWAPVSYFTDKFGIDIEKIKSYLEGVLSIEGHDKKGEGALLYDEEQLIQLLTKAGFNENKSARGNTNEITEEELREIELQKQATDFIRNISEGETVDAKEFRDLISLFGPSSVVDVFYKFNSAFRGLSPDFIKSVIAEYLGEFLVQRHGFGGDHIEKGLGYLGESNLKECLLAGLKLDCLENLSEKKKLDKSIDNKVVIRDYIRNKKEQADALKDERYIDVVIDLESYYEKVLQFKKPDTLVNSLDNDRDFPDINQSINMQEIYEKKKMLIADEMGLGKSASVILTKESLGIKKALVIVPSNVVNTWKTYLSDKIVKDRDGNDKQAGYFKKGQAPDVLTLNSIEDFDRINEKEWDYIMISQERLNDTYTKKLMEIDVGMLIVDEVHKLKNLKYGVRAQNLVSLANKIQGDDKYLAILSGTPVPNKITDVAMILKLLYPEKFENMDNKKMVENIIYGDLIDLRSLLIPRMQMKNRSSLEMPKFIEHEPILCELSEFEKNIYIALLEEDEHTATQKIQLLRQFLLNPEIIDATPGIPTSKFNAFQEELDKDFQKVDKIVVFVNNYVEGVIRGDKSIIEKLKLPPDVEVRIIHGDDNKKERPNIENDLKNSNKKMLVIVSGQTADVGVDFSGGDMIYNLNEPWTKAEQAQQVARVYRYGVKHDIECKTFITRGTIEEGIHRFINIKQRSVEKLLKGIPRTELDKEIMEKTERQDNNKEVNPELAQYYLSAFDRLNKMFREIREIGEEGFMNYIDMIGKDMTFGDEYSEAYFLSGNRSYQSNANRIAASLISDFMEKSDKSVKDIHILDLASGPEMLKKHSPDEFNNRIVSIDAIASHFSRSTGWNRVVGKITDLETPFVEKSFDYLNFSFALHYTNFKPGLGLFNRLEVFKEMNYVLKDGGRAIINLVHSDDIKNIESFKEMIKSFGFKVIEDYTGDIKEGDIYKSKVITLEKTKDLDKDFSIENLVNGMTKEQADGFRLKKVKDKLKQQKQKQILTNFTFEGKIFDIKLNSLDKKIYEEEQEIMKKGEELKKTYGSIENIPFEEIVNNKFVRFRPKESYRLFKLLETSEGAVVIK